ncbi:MAG: hypothetical protein HC922_10195 [Leptolyngbyaceae cyanobacterium SM2_3_12]|nr:hypothetical protein [Leptolyngbyaceae cyanobacterium SM2_3_12]
MLLGSGARLALAVLLGTGGVSLAHLAAPPVAQAYTSRLNLFLVREPDESFTSFVQRSEIIARAAVQRSFDSDVLMTDVVVTIVGDSQTIAVPILTVDVSRRDWQLRPDVRQWARYYDAAQGLME